MDIEDYLNTLKGAQEKLLSQSFSEFSETTKSSPLASVTPEILSQFSPIFMQFLAWQRLMQINQNLLDVHSKVQSTNAAISAANQSKLLEKAQKEQNIIENNLSPLPQSYSNYFNSDNNDQMEMILENEKKLDLQNNHFDSQLSREDIEMNDSITDQLLNAPSQLDDTENTDNSGIIDYLLTEKSLSPSILTDSLSNNDQFTAILQSQSPEIRQPNQPQNQTSIGGEYFNNNINNINNNNNVPSFTRSPVAIAPPSNILTGGIAVNPADFLAMGYGQYTAQAQNSYKNNINPIPNTNANVNVNVNAIANANTTQYPPIAPVSFPPVRGQRIVSENRAIYDKPPQNAPINANTNTNTNAITNTTTNNNINNNINVPQTNTAKKTVQKKAATKAPTTKKAPNLPKGTKTTATTTTTTTPPPSSAPPSAPSPTSIQPIAPKPTSLPPLAPAPVVNVVPPSTFSHNPTPLESNNNSNNNAINNLNNNNGSSLGGAPKTPPGPIIVGPRDNDRILRNKPDIPVTLYLTVKAPTVNPDLVWHSTFTQFPVIIGRGLDNEGLSLNLYEYIDKDPAVKKVSHIHVELHLHTYSSLIMKCVGRNGLLLNDNFVPKGQKLVLSNTDNFAFGPFVFTFKTNY